MRQLALLSAGMLALGSATSSSADVITAVPTAWRLQNYVGDVVTVFYTGSPCVSGGLQLPASATVEDKSRFFSLVLTAKLLLKSISVTYTYNSGAGSCMMSDFYIEG